MAMLAKNGLPSMTKFPARSPRGRASTGLREDEEFVINAVARAFSGTWRPGEDPPDAYLAVGPEAIAVEITTLTQHVTDDRGTRPRLSDDIATAKLANDLNDELQSLIPDGYTIGLILSSPIREPRKTKAALAEIIRSHLLDLSSLVPDRKLDVRGNPVTLYADHHGEMQYKKVSAAFMNRGSNPDIQENVAHILEERIAAKSQSCARLREHGPLWLALLNDYWLTDADTYRHALSLMTISHPFQKLLLIGGDGSVEHLFGGS
jgi:hypothetical protein